MNEPATLQKSRKILIPKASSLLLVALVFFCSTSHAFAQDFCKTHTFSDVKSRFEKPPQALSGEWLRNAEFLIVARLIQDPVEEAIRDLIPQCTTYDISDGIALRKLQFTLANEDETLFEDEAMNQPGAHLIVDRQGTMGSIIETERSSKKVKVDPLGITFNDVDEIYSSSSPSNKEMTKQTYTCRYFDERHLVCLARLYFQDSRAMTSITEHFEIFEKRPY